MVHLCSSFHLREELASTPLASPTEAGPARLTEALEGHTRVVPGSPGRMNKQSAYLTAPSSGLGTKEAG